MQVEVYVKGLKPFPEAVDEGQHETRVTDPGGEEDTKVAFEPTSFVSALVSRPYLLFTFPETKATFSTLILWKKKVPNNGYYYKIP